MIQDIKLTDIEVDNDFNCRGQEMTPSDVYDIMDSIKEFGLLSPVLVRPSRKPKYKYFLFAGFRRYAACKYLGMETIKAIVHDTITDVGAETLNLVENIEREGLNIVQEANGVNKLYLRGINVGEIARSLKQSRDWVNVRISLLQLPADIQKEAAAGILTQKAIKEILPIYKADKTRAYKIVAEIRDKKLKHDKKSVDSKSKKEKVIKTRTFRPFSEVFKMQDLLLDTFGNNLASRAIAWTISEISTQEFLDDIKQEYSNLGISKVSAFIIPQDYYDSKYKKDKVQDVDG